MSWLAGVHTRRCRLLRRARAVFRLAVGTASLGACGPRAHLPPVPERITDAADSSGVALARRLAPVLYVQKDEWFPLDRVVAVLHPDRPIVSYHLLWRNDINGQWVPWAKATDEEEVWVGYDPTTTSPTDVWTYWHGSILHADWRGKGVPAISVQWGKHGSLPHDVIESDLPRPRTLNFFYAVEFVLLPDIFLGHLSHGGPLGFFHSYRRYRDFSRVVPLSGRLAAVVRAVDARPALHELFGTSYANKRWWPGDPLH